VITLHTQTFQNHLKKNDQSDPRNRDSPHSHSSEQNIDDSQLHFQTSNLNIEFGAHSKKRIQLPILLFPQKSCKMSQIEELGMTVAVSLMNRFLKLSADGFRVAEVLTF
jgi:hypothetical protein